MLRDGINVLGAWDGMLDTINIDFELRLILPLPKSRSDATIPCRVVKVKYSRLSQFIGGGMEMDALDGAHE